MTLHSSKGQNLSANQISSTYLNSRLRYIYFRFGKTNVRHIGIFLLLLFRPYRSNRHAILHQSTKFHPNRSTRGKIRCNINFQRWRKRLFSTTSGFQLLMSLLQKVKVYHQTKFRRHSSIHGCIITTSVLEKQTSVVLEFYFRFCFRPFLRNRRVILR